MVGQLTSMTSPILGYIADRYGAKVLANMIALSCWFGLALVLVAAETGVDQLLYIAFACLGLTAWMGGLLAVQTGLYFKGKMQSRVISALNALLDAGSVTYLGVWGIGEWTGASVTVLISGYLVLAVLVFGGALYFWSVAVPDSEEEEEADIVRKFDTTVESSIATPKTASDDDGSGQEQLSCTPPQIAMPPELEAAQLESAIERHL
jgi:MFS family permease